MEMEETTTSTILLIAKIGAMVGLGFGSLFLGMLPLIVGRYRINHRQKRHRGISSNSSTCTSTSVSNASSSSVIYGSAGNSQVRFKSSTKNRIFARECNSAWTRQRDWKRFVRVTFTFISLQRYRWFDIVD